MQKIATDLPGVFIIEPRVYGDARGFFMETYNRAAFGAIGIDSEFVQDNHSLSARGTVRGLHYQLRFAQAKLCRVVRGEVLDAVVDIRRGSPHFGRAVTVVLSAENKREIFVPRGFAHGFAVLSDSAEFVYKCDQGYRPEDEHGVAWNDPDLGIDWQVTEPLLSERDALLPRLRDVLPELLPDYVSP